MCSNNFISKEIKDLNKKYKKIWGKDVDYKIIPFGITQEKLMECLKLMIETNDSLLVSYNKLYNQKKED